MFECKTCHHNPIVLMTQKGKWFATCSNYKCFSHGDEKIMLFNRKQDAINEWNKENPYNVIYHNIKLKNNFTFVTLDEPIYHDAQTSKRSFSEYMSELIELKKNDYISDLIEQLKGDEKNGYRSNRNEP